MPRAQLSQSPAKGPTASSRTRPTREKKSRKIFDPADHELPPSKRQKRNQSPEYIFDDSPHPKSNKSSNSNNNSVKLEKKLCQICGIGTTTKLSIMLKCSDCSKTVHSKCLDYSDELAHHVLSMPTWQCVNCKFCAQCKKSNGEDFRMLFCDSCDRGYHMSCHRPPLKSTPIGHWDCFRCNNQDVISSNSKKIQGSSEQSGSSQSSQDSLELSPSDRLIAQFASLLPQRDVLTSLSNRHEVIKSHDLSTIKRDDVTKSTLKSDVISQFCVDLSNVQNIPDVSSWSGQQISDFFRHKGFQEGLCNVFVQQEIDGSALILLERQDILENLGLRLGPALKVFELVKKLKDKHFLQNQL